MITICYTNDENNKAVKYKFEDTKIIYKLTTDLYRYIFKI